MNTRVFRIILTLLFCTLGFKACFADDAVAPMQAAGPAEPLPLQKKSQLLHQALSQEKFIHGGSYMMGTDDKRYMDGFTGDNIHPHKVTLTSFYFPKYLVSGNQFNSYLAISSANAHRSMREGLEPTNGDWQYAHNYCAWLAQESGLPFSLPTEAQWEYVARNEGKDDAYPTPNGQLELGKNYPAKKNFVYKLEHPDMFGPKGVNDLVVNAPPINKIGIHQMGGNVSEWMQDWYARDYYWHSPKKNPQGPATDDGNMGFGAPLKVARGIMSTGIEFYDSWRVSASSYNRLHKPMTEDLIGFRCVINSDKPMAALKAEMEKKLQAD